MREERNVRITSDNSKPFGWTIQDIEICPNCRKEFEGLSGIPGLVEKHPEVQLVDPFEKLAQTSRRLRIYRVKAGTSDADLRYGMSRLPDGTKLVGHSDHVWFTTNDIALKFEHESFDEVLGFDPIPIFDLDAPPKDGPWHVGADHIP
jgi:hypothetical protein